MIGNCPLGVSSTRVGSGDGTSKVVLPPLPEGGNGTLIAALTDCGGALEPPNKAIPRPTTIRTTAPPTQIS